MCVQNIKLVVHVSEHYSLFILIWTTLLSTWRTLAVDLLKLLENQWANHSRKSGLMFL
jgi:hypothetical protein